MIPLGDASRRPLRFPLATVLVIAVNFLVFFFELAGGDAFINRWSLVPANIVAGQDWITILTAMFMHAGWVHIGGNMLYLWIFGDNVEDRFGHLQYLLFYLICGIAATFAQLAFSIGSSIPSLGASGAIAGVLGAYLLLFPQRRVTVLLGYGVTQMPALIVIGLWFVLQLFSGIGSIAGAADTGGVAYMAHVGGFIAGLALAFILRGNRVA